MLKTAMVMVRVSETKEINGDLCVGEAGCTFKVLKERVGQVISDEAAMAWGKELVHQLGLPSSPRVCSVRARVRP